MLKQRALGFGGLVRQVPQPGGFVLILSSLLRTGGSTQSLRGFRGFVGHFGGFKSLCYVVKAQGPKVSRGAFLEVRRA